MKHLIKPTHLLAWLLLLLISADALGAQLVARLDRARIVEGDPVVLTLTASGGFNGAPDLTPLQQGFDLVNRSQSTYMRFINGRSSSGTEWRLTLMPKGTGKIEIPALRLGSATSRPLTLEVLPASQAADQGIARPVMIEVDAEPKNPFVQQKVIYTVRVLMAGPLRDVTLSEPGINDALVHPIGQERRYETYRQGRQFQAVERQYAVQPQLSGTLEIAGPLLTGRISDPNSAGNNPRGRLFGSDPFSNLGRMFDQGRPITVRGSELTLEVRPQPAGTASPWLPAETLTLSDAWAPDPPVFRVGEPVTRSITISATGLAGEQLPELAFDLPVGMKAYPERARAETRPGNGTLLARKTIKAALIPSQPGDNTLPEIRVSWWDVAAGKEVVATLPARRIEVLPAAPGSVTTMPPAASAAKAGPYSADSEPVADTAVNPRSAVVQGSGGAWPWIAGLLAVAVVVISALWLRERQSRQTAEPPVHIPPSNRATEPPADPTRALVAVERAFRADDPKGARKALLAWAKTQWPSDPPSRLDTIAQRLGGRADPILQDLDGALYGNSGANAWDGRHTWPELKELLTKHDNTIQQSLKNNNLPPLYPASH